MLRLPLLLLILLKIADLVRQTIPDRSHLVPVRDAQLMHRFLLFGIERVHLLLEHRFHLFVHLGVNIKNLIFQDRIHFLAKLCLVSSRQLVELLLKPSFVATIHGLEPHLQFLLDLSDDFLDLVRRRYHLANGLVYHSLIIRLQLLVIAALMLVIAFKDPLEGQLFALHRSEGVFLRSRDVFLLSLRTDNL